MTTERCPQSEGFELLILEGVHAGLSWATILKKRENYRHAFNSFDPLLIARYDDEKVATLLADSGIDRNRAKVAASIQNAKACLALTVRPVGSHGMAPIAKTIESPTGRRMTAQKDAQFQEIYPACIIDIQ